MDRQKLIIQRWKKTEQILKKKQSDFKALYNGLAVDIVNTANSFNLTAESLTKKASKSIITETKRKLEEWKDKEGYFGYYVRSFNKFTNIACLELAIYGLYELSYQYDEALKALMEIAEDHNKQGANDSGEDRSDIKRKKVEEWAFILSLNATLHDYMAALIYQAVQETLSQIVVCVQNDTDIKVDLDKQRKRIVNIHDSKESGILTQEARQVGNKAYLNSDGDRIVEFIAEQDERTTPMCKSMDGLLFHTKQENTFRRYSASNESNITVRCFGMVEGLNLPPIEDHFHWCRSITQYKNK